MHVFLHKNVNHFFYSAIFLSLLSFFSYTFPAYSDEKSTIIFPLQTEEFSLQKEIKGFLIAFDALSVLLKEFAENKDEIEHYYQALLEEYDTFEKHCKNLPHHERIIAFREYKNKIDAFTNRFLNILIAFFHDKITQQERLIFDFESFENSGHLQKPQYREILQNVQTDT